MGFVLAGDAPTRHVVSIWGDSKEGKTHLALTFPPPLYFLSLDPGVRELLWKFPGKPVYISDLEMTEKNDPVTYQKLLDQFVTDYVKALLDAGDGTVVVDTATQVWQIVQKVKLHAVAERREAAFRVKFKKEPEPGEIKLYPYDYGDANTFMGGLLRRAMLQRTANVVFIHRVREKYNESGQPTGVYGPQWFGETPAITQATIRTYVPQGGKGFVGQITQCRQNPELRGLEVPNLDYEALHGLLTD